MRRQLVAAAVLLAAAVPPGARQDQPQPAAEQPLRQKILVINLDPIIEGADGRRLHEVGRWNDPAQLLREYMADLTECSHDQLTFNVVETITADAFPVKQDGFRYTDADYLKCVRNEQPWHQPDAVDYRALVNEFRLAERVEKHEVDEVWFFAMPYSGFFESTMAGSGAYYCNSDPIADVACSRIFITMGFNYERGVGEMLEDFGHRTESIMTHVFGRWENDQHPLEQLNPGVHALRQAAAGQGCVWQRALRPQQRPGLRLGQQAHRVDTCESWRNLSRAAQDAAADELRGLGQRRHSPTSEQVVAVAPAGRAGHDRRQAQQLVALHGRLQRVRRKPSGEPPSRHGLICARESHTFTCSTPSEPAAPRPR
ncbi:MAG: hypothetical protein U1E76_27120 [Planctomycetota bacterium]